MSDSQNGGGKNATGGGVFVPRSASRLAIVRRDNPSRLALFQRVYEGKANKSQCIKAFCLDCMGFDSVAVRECGDRLCPLWRHRPFQTKTPKTT